MAVRNSQKCELAGNSNKSINDYYMVRIKMVGSGVRYTTITIRAHGEQRRVLDPFAIVFNYPSYQLSPSVPINS